MKKKKTWIWLVIIVIVLIVLWMFLRPKEESYETTTVTVDSISTNFSYSGDLTATKRYDLVATAEYTIETVYVCAMQDVTEDTLLFDSDEGDEFYSDIDGRLIGLNVAPDDDVSIQTVMATVVDPSSWQVSINADENDVTRMSVGEAVTVHINSLDIDVPGSIKQISAEGVKAGTVQVFPVVIAVGDNANLKPGMSVEVSIPKDNVENALVLPIDAVNYDSDGSAYVYVLEDGEKIRKDITVGVSDTRKTQIVDGLSEGDEVIVDNSSNYGTIISEIHSEVTGSDSSDSSRSSSSSSSSSEGTE